MTALRDKGFKTPGDDVQTAAKGHSLPTNKGGRSSQCTGPGLADTSLFSTVHDSGLRVPQSHQDSPLLYHKHSEAKGSSPPVWNCAHISLSKGLGVRGKQGCSHPLDQRHLTTETEHSRGRGRRQHAVTGHEGLTVST